MTSEPDDADPSDPRRDESAEGVAGEPNDGGSTEGEASGDDDHSMSGSPGSEPTRDGVSESGEREIGESPEFARSGRPLEPYRFVHERPHPDDPREYGPVRRFARDHAGRFRILQRWLDQAGFGTSYDRYLGRCARTGLAGAAVGLLLGVLVAVALTAGSLGDVIDGGGAVGTVVAAAGATVGGAILGAVLGAVGGFGARFLYPLAVARHRARRVRVGLPHAIIFLYALSHGGVNLYESAHRLADAEETYGPISAEFRRIVQDTRLFDRDLFDALVSARTLTPADRFAVFLDELVNVLETGGDVGTFLQNEAESTLEAAQERQEELLNDMDSLAEVYIVFIFAGPVFLLVVLLVISFIAPDVVWAMQALVYLLVPLAMVGFLGVFWWLMAPYVEHVGAPIAGESVAWTDTDGAEQPPDDPRIDAYHEDGGTSLRQRLARGPAETLRNRPVLVLYVTAPLGLLVALVTWFTVPWSDSTLSGAGLIAIPFLLSAVPYGTFYELKRRRQRDVRKRFPDALETVAEGVDNDVPLSDCFALVAGRTGGTLAEELHRAHRDVGWTNDIGNALARFADRMGVPQVTRTVRLLEEGVRSTDDLGPVFRLVADHLDRRNTIRRERRQQMQPYIIIVFLGVVVYLAIVAMFDAFFLPVVAERAAATSIDSSPLQINPAPPSTYRRLFFHSALIQAVGNGLLLGKLTDNRLRSGVAFAAVLVVIVLATFLLMV